MAAVTKSQVVNDVIVLDYSAGDYAKYLKDMAAYEQRIMLGSSDLSEVPERPEIKNALNGLRIMECNVSEQSTMTRSPVENGVYIADCKVRQPNRITIRGICDNLRGDVKVKKDTRSNFDSGVPLVGGAINKVVNGVTDYVMGYEFETEQEILTRARAVFASIHAMYVNKDRVDGGRPKTWIVSTKGAVYQNMVLRDVEQLNDAEHLLVVPVTLTFEELMMIGDDESESVFLDDDNSPLKMGGSMKKGNLAERFVDGLKSIM